MRCEAIRRRLAVETRRGICDDLGRSTSWFGNWWSIYQNDPCTDFAGRCRAPQTLPPATPKLAGLAVIAIRQTPEAATTPATRYGLVGPRAIQAQLERPHLAVPSTTTIQRILDDEGLTHPICAGSDSSYHP